MKNRVKVLVNIESVSSGSRGVKEYYSWLLKSFSEASNCDGFSFEEIKVKRFKQLYSFLLQGKRVVWSPSHATSLLSFGHVVTVHDLITLDNSRLQKKWIKFGVLYINLLFVFLFSSSIVCISNYTKSSVRSYFPFFKRKFKVFSSPSFVPVGESLEKFEALNECKFFLLVSNDLPHKNNDFVINNVSSFLDVHKLKLVVVGVENKNFLNDENVFFYNGLSEDKINYLYKKCLFICSPSLAEGHNIVISKGRYLGKPIMASDIPVHREYYPESVFFNPSEVESFEKALKQSLELSLSCDKLDYNEIKTIEQLTDQYLELFESKTIHK